MGKNWGLGRHGLQTQTVQKPTDSLGRLSSIGQGGKGPQNPTNGDTTNWAERRPSSHSPPEEDAKRTTDHLPFLTIDEWKH
jgi:hypothetical protein